MLKSVRGVMTGFVAAALLMGLLAIAPAAPIGTPQGGLAPAAALAAVSYDTQTVTREGLSIELPEDAEWDTESELYLGKVDDMAFGVQVEEWQKDEFSTSAWKRIFTYDADDWEEFSEEIYADENCTTLGSETYGNATTTVLAFYNYSNDNKTYDKGTWLVRSEDRVWLMMVVIDDGGDFDAALEVLRGIGRNIEVADEVTSYVKDGLFVFTPEEFCEQLSEALEVVNEELDTDLSVELGTYSDMAACVISDGSREAFVVWFMDAEGETVLDPESNDVEGVIATCLDGSDGFASASVGVVMAVDPAVDILEATDVCIAAVEVATEEDGYYENNDIWYNFVDDPVALLILAA